MRTGVEFTVLAEQRRQLEAVANDGNSRQKHAARARIILLSNDGLGRWRSRPGPARRSRRIRRGVHDSIEQLERAILDFIYLHNGKEAKPFHWTASPERIIAARQRGNQVLRTIN